MPAVAYLKVRDLDDHKDEDDHGDDSDGSSSAVNLTVVILCLVIFGLLLVGVLLVFRRMKKQKKLQGANPPPQYNDVVPEGKRSNHHRLTIETRGGHSSVLVMGRNGQPMLSDPNKPPHSPDNVPEIHITFPDDEENGRRKSGRVLVVRVGDNAVGLEPLDEEDLPAYEKEGSQFYSIDMDDIGGLKEKKEREDYR